MQFLESAIPIGILGALAFIVSIIVEVLKEIPLIKKIPTKLIVIVVALTVTIVTLFIYAAYMVIVVLWYHVVFAIFGGFVVAYISMYGWDTLKDLKDRYMRKD